MFQGEKKLSGPRPRQKETEGLAQETGRKDRPIGGWQRRGRGTRLHWAWSALFRTLLSVSEQRGNSGSVVSKGGTSSGLSPTEMHWFKLSVLSGLATWPGMSFGVRLPSAQKSLLCPH